MVSASVESVVGQTSGQLVKPKKHDNHLAAEIHEARDFSRMVRQLETAAEFAAGDVGGLEAQ
jgi:hypothetical protein